ncbi:hypothetical protein [Paenibacillus sp. EPM92]|uniref:hypothetical protein n=1 Tax=Paenibacillus sp. EPM92 TaxID=1561195 RepID=UPI001914E723|nr:hypothetical protein [Paenibacillus sp. EPM92]
MSNVVIVKVITSYNRDGFSREKLYIDGKKVMTVGPLTECPEDAILERDLVGPSDFASLLKDFLIEHKSKQVKFVYENEEEEE